MILEGKCLEEFNEYVLNNVYKNAVDPNPHWLSCNDSMKWGVLVDYFDSVGLNILLTVEFDYGYIIAENRYQEIEEVKKWYETRPEARTAAIESACRLRNEQLNSK